MSIQVAIFEDDKDLAEILEERMQLRKFEVASYFNLKDSAWLKSDIVLGDFRNKMVSFQTLSAECKKNGIPIIAISGAETGFEPQLIKPFTIEELEAVILKEMMNASMNTPKREKKSEGGFLSKLFK